MSGQLKVRRVEKGQVVIHCLASPDDGERVNAQIIETPHKLVLVDVMLLRACAQELREYALGLGKPIDRVFITHAHPDHWFGQEFFQDQAIYAFPETIGEIQAFADLAIGFHRSQHGEAVTDRAWLPGKTVEPGDLEIDGITFRILKIANAEDVAMLALVLPAERVLIAQDLVYNQVHLFVGQRSMDGTRCHDGWIAALEAFQKMDFDLVFPGHGVPSEADVLAENIRYLRKAKAILETATGEDFVQRTLDAFPGYELRSMVDMSAFFLFQM